MVLCHRRFAVVNKKKMGENLGFWEGGTYMLELKCN